MENREAINLLSASMIQATNRIKMELYAHCVQQLMKEEASPAKFDANGNEICPICRNYTPPAANYCSACGQRVKEARHGNDCV